MPLLVVQFFGMTGGPHLFIPSSTGHRASLGPMIRCITTMSVSVGRVENFQVLLIVVEISMVKSWMKQVVVSAWTYYDQHVVEDGNTQGGDKGSW